MRDTQGAWMFIVLNVSIMLYRERYRKLRQIVWKVTYRSHWGKISSNFLFFPTYTLWNRFNVCVMYLYSKLMTLWIRSVCEGEKQWRRSEILFHAPKISEGETYNLLVAYLSVSTCQKRVAHAQNILYARPFLLFSLITFVLWTHFSSFFGWADERFGEVFVLQTDPQ